MACDGSNAMIPTSNFSHSADVQIWLEFAEREPMALSRVTPKSVVARVPCDMPACMADLVVVIDGRKLRSRLHLSQGFRGRVARAILMDGDTASSIPQTLTHGPQYLL